jgi:kynureninase
MTEAATAPPLTAEELAGWRRRFPILDRCTYLISNSLGAMPDTVPQSLAAYADQWATKGVEAWASDWLPEVRAVADLLADLLGAPAGSVVVHQNVATLTGMVFSALDLSGTRNRIVLSDAEWPSHRYLADQHASLGAEVVVVPTDGVGVDTGRLLDAIDDRTALVIASHVLFRTGFIQDVEEIAERARDAGALSLIDGYHAAGHLPVDVPAIGCDFYTGGSVKWLCGGPGVGYLAIRPDMHERLRPRAVGWLGHATPFAFEPAWKPADDASAWLGGTPAVPAIYAAREGYRIIAEVGPERIRATSMPLTARLVEGALERGLTVRTPLDPDRRAGAVTIDLGDGTDEVARQLVAGGIIVDHRPGAGIRVGPHFYNTAQECDALLDALPRR